LSFLPLETLENTFQAKSRASRCSRELFSFFFVLDFLEIITFWGSISKINQDAQEIKTLKNSQVIEEESRVIKLKFDA
jgi:hypothetical protein